MTRRTRRRLFVLGVCAAAGLSLPLWAPRLLSTLPAFRVERIEVSGTYYVAPDAIVSLADVEPTASVWDDPSAWEARVRAHPLVREARVHRRGLDRLEIRVREERPVALAAVPALVPVSGEGRLLPLDPAEAALDLPVLAGVASVEHGRLAGPHRRLAELVDRLEEYDPGFARQVSEVAALEGGGVEFVMLESAACARILLPSEAPGRGLRRVELALAQARGTDGGAAGAAGARVVRADARFADRVVLALGKGSSS